MKVVLLAPTPPPYGGIQSWTMRMLSASLKDGWTVAVVDEKAIGKREIFGKSGRRNLFEEIRRSVTIWHKLIVELRDPEARVVQSCIPSTTFAMMREYVCALITRRRKRKFITHFRCTVPNLTQSSFGKMMLKRLCAKSDLILSLNEQTSSFLRGLTDTPIRLVPNFVSPSELNERYVVREEIKTVLYVGGIVELKGVKDCVDVAASFPDISFRFVGKGDDSIESYARSKHVDNAVFVGPLDHEAVKEEMGKADLFLFLSRFRGEGFSNALCEAMAAGLPCIVTDWAANADMIRPDGGAVVALHDIKAVENAIKALSDKSIRERCSEANIRKVKAEYLEPIVLDQYVDVYNKLMNA